MFNGLRFSPSGALRKICAPACLALLCATAGSAADGDDPLAAQRTEFQQAYGRIAQSAGAMVDDSALLQQYVLYPYLQAARLELALRLAGPAVPAALDDEVAFFLRSHDREPVAQDLRRTWLATLAARARWPQFLEFHRPASDDVALRCHGFTARIELGRDADLAPEVARTWLTPRSVLECDRAFTWLTESGGMTPELIERRVRLALEAGNAGFARQIIPRLPASRAAPLLQWAALLDNPQREIDALIAGPRAPVEADALLAGWTKFARANRTGARQRFDRLVRARGLDRKEASPLALALALALSWDRDAESLRYFARVDASDFDDGAREWQTRAALWGHDWTLAARSIAAMTETTRQTARWRYWAARVAAQQGSADTAAQLYESILREDNYYSAMAAARLKRRISPDLQPLAPDAAAMAGFEDTPAFVRARELRRVGLVDKARVEWSLGQSQQSPALRPQTIHLAAAWGWFQQAVATATGERIFNDYVLLYPRPYDSEVAAGAKETGLARETIYGVIRQESLYERDAISTADARGLMQLTPSTARQTARKWNLPEPSLSDLFEPAINVALGAAHLKDMLDRYNGQLPVALAAYNAGPNAAQRWLPEMSVDSDIWIENIPYNETRSYVQRILWHTVVFDWLPDREPVDTTAWLRQIDPR